MGKKQHATQDIEENKATGQSTENPAGNQAEEKTGPANASENREAPTADFAGQDEIKRLNARIAELENQVKEAGDQRLRAHAELENFRKRKNQEVEDFKKYSKQVFISDILAVLDSVSMACDHAKENATEEEQGIQEGFFLIQKQLDAFLEKMDVKAIAALHQKFDPNLHQAISQEEAEGIEAETITRVVQNGYTLHGKVIRPSMVIVAK